MFDAPPPSGLEALDPRVRKALVDGLWDLGINFVAEEHEERSFFTEPHFDEDEARIARAIEASIVDGSGKQFHGTGYDRAYMLAGFEHAAQDLKHEIAILAWTDAENTEAFRYLTAGRGTASAVALPVNAAWPSLMRRVAERIPTKVLALHNHPRYPGKDFIEELLGGTPIGPSGTDRSTTWSWLDIQVRSGFAVVPEFVLYESGEFRRIRWPSAAMIREAWATLNKGR